MYDYTAYGLTIRSDIPLPELVEASALQTAPTPRPQGEPDVRITVADLPQSQRGNGDEQRDVRMTADTAFVDYPATASYFVAQGREITIKVVPEADPRLIRLYLLGPILALLLHQRKFLVLHASAVSVDGQALAFVGEKGMGKSTMAAAMHARGHALVADDLVAVDTTRPTPLVYPAFPQLKLFPASAALLDSSPEELPKIHPELEKRARRSAEGFPTDPLVLRGVYVLNDANAESIELLPARVGFMELVRHSYLLAFLKATGSAELHFRQAIDLASKTPVLRLNRRRTFDALGTIAGMLEGKIESLA